MIDQNKILSRIFVDFDDILSRYQRFNKLFFNKLQDQIVNNSMAKELIKAYHKNPQKSNIKTEQIFNMEQNENNILIAEANSQYILKLLKKYPSAMKEFFENNEINAIANNATDYLFGLQHLIISIDVKMELFTKLLHDKNIDKNKVLNLEEIKKELTTYKEVSKIRNIVAHNDAVVDDLFRKDFKLEKKDEDNISFCLAGLGKIDQYIHDYTIIILYITKHYLDSNIFSYYNSFKCSKKIKLTEEEIFKINRKQNNG